MADVEKKCAHPVCECKVPPHGPHGKCPWDPVKILVKHRVPR